MGRVLIIKHGALGDFVLALGPMSAIRRHHSDAHIVLLTTAPYARFAERCPYVDEVWVDSRPGVGDLPGIWRLRRRLRRAGFDRVYDLQTSGRSSLYHRLLGPGHRPEWSGIAKDASHPHANPARDTLHTIERQRDQLAFAGILDVPAPDLSWVTGDPAAFGVADDFVILVPGGSAHRPAKRWPVERFSALARWIAARGPQPVVIGGPGETAMGAAIRQAEPTTLDLTGRTDFADIAALGRFTRHVVGNDTGPMHLLAVAGAPSTVLFSAASDPVITAPRGADVTILARDSLADLPVAEVAATLRLG